MNEAKEIKSIAPHEGREERLAKHRIQYRERTKERSASETAAQ